jgi:uncharacterized membrane protein
MKKDCSSQRINTRFLSAARFKNFGPVRGEEKPDKKCTYAVTLR